MSHHFQGEIAFLGIESSPSFVRAPELLEFKARFNKRWILQRHRYATPEQVRSEHASMAVAA